MSGKSHQFKAVLTPPGSNNARRTYEGLWHISSKDTRTGQTFTDVQGPKEEITVSQVEDMDEWESRRLWRWVAKGIREGDFETASREKSKIEVSTDCVVPPNPVLLTNAAIYVMTERAEAKEEG